VQGRRSAGLLLEEGLAGGWAQAGRNPLQTGHLLGLPASPDQFRPGPAQATQFDAGLGGPTRQRIGRSPDHQGTPATRSGRHEEFPSGIEVGDREALQQPATLGIPQGLEGQEVQVPVRHHQQRLHALQARFQGRDEQVPEATRLLVGNLGASLEDLGHQAVHADLPRALRGASLQPRIQEVLRRVRRGRGRQQPMVPDLLAGDQEDVQPVVQEGILQEDRGLGQGPPHFKGAGIAQELPGPGQAGQLDLQAIPLGRGPIQGLLGAAVGGGPRQDLAGPQDGDLGSLELAQHEPRLGGGGRLQGPQAGHVQKPAAAPLQGLQGPIRPAQGQLDARRGAVEGVGGGRGGALPTGLEGLPLQRRSGRLGPLRRLLGRFQAASQQLHPGQGSGRHGLDQQQAPALGLLPDRPKQGPGPIQLPLRGLGPGQVHGGSQAVQGKILVLPGGQGLPSQSAGLARVSPSQGQAG